MGHELPANYSFNLGEREDRITARRARIAARLAAAEREGNGAGGAVEIEGSKKTGKGAQQVAESRKRLAKMTLAGNELVTGVRVTADLRESERLLQEAERRAQLREALLQESEAAAHENAAVAMKWPDISRQPVAEDLFRDIEAQRAACDHIMAGKEALIGELRAELKLKDDDYVKSLKRQAEEVEALLTHMGAQFRELQGACREELEEAEAAFLAERADLIEAHKSEMAFLFERRNVAETAFMEAQAARREEFLGALETQRVEDAESYNILKIRLETDIANLEQHLEAMRATYQLNTEKLEYNYRVLNERDHENQSTINQQKRKISRQRDILSSLKAKYAETDKKFQDDNAHLTDEYRRVTEQFKDLQAKFVHFEAADSRRYREVWAMNSEAARGLVTRVLEADRVIHEQQLGLDWAGPDPARLAPPPPESESAAAAAAAAAAEAAGEGGGSGAADALVAALADPRQARLVALLCDEAGFLADSKAREVLSTARRITDESTAPGAPPAGGNGSGGSELVLVSSVLEALGVSDGPSFDALASALSADTPAPRPAGATAVPPLHPPPTGTGLTRLVAPEEVMRRLKAFVDAEQSSLGASGKSVRLAAAAAPTEARRKVGADAAYWQRLSGVISPRMLRVWTALEGGLQKYHGLLQGRQGLLGDTAGLQRQNAELRGLLNQYLASKINTELRVPPTQLL